MIPTQRLAFLITAAGLMAGCVTQTAPTPAPPPPETLVVDPLPPPPPPPPPPPTLAEQQQAQRIALSAMDLLEAGSEEQARIELLRALASDSNNRLALALLKQLSVDPVVALGKESFQYVVKPGETLSKIAHRFMGDLYSFYLLARYNDIKVPRQLAGGQVIRIPGKAPPVTKIVPPDTVQPTVQPTVLPPVLELPPEPPEVAFRSAEAAERDGDLDRAYTEYQRAGSHPGAAAKVEQVRKQLVLLNTKAARTAFARQDLDGTIGYWKRVLELEPTNETARLEFRKTEELWKKWILRNVR